MKHYVRLTVLSESISPEKISSQLGVLGDETWKVGDERKHTTIVEKDNGWILYSKKESFIDLEDHIDYIRNFIKGYEGDFKRLSDSYNCDIQLSCTIYYKDEPPLFFEKETIIWLNSIGASLDVDLYKTEK